MSVETETKDKSYANVKSFFSLRYLERILNRHIDDLITANDNTMRKINIIIERLERRSHSRNGGDL
jgi:hypothetical protein